MKNSGFWNSTNLSHQVFCRIPDDFRTCVSVVGHVKVGDGGGAPRVADPRAAVRLVHGQVAVGVALGGAEQAALRSKMDYHITIFYNKICHSNSNLDDKVGAVECRGIVEALLHALADVLYGHGGGVRPQGQLDVPQACLNDQRGHAECCYECTLMVVSGLQPLGLFVKLWW